MDIDEKLDLIHKRLNELRKEIKNLGVIANYIKAHLIKRKKNNYLCA